MVFPGILTSEHRGIKRFHAAGQINAVLARVLAALAVKYNSNVIPHNMMYSHTVIIGGTGMLRAASIRLAGQSRRLTSVARTRHSLAALDGALPEGHGAHHMLALDWSDPDAFIQAITRHLESTEQPDLVVAWVHSTRLGVRLAASLGKRDVRFFHVIGSAAANPAKIAAQAQGQAMLPRTVAYHQVILGAVRQGTGLRWLANDEISCGVLAAVRARQTRFVVGTLGDA